MQKNLPAYAPASIRRVSQWSEASHREVVYAVAEDVADAGVVRQPAGGGVPRAALPAGASRTGPRPSCSTSTRRRARASTSSWPRRAWSAQALDEAGLVGAVKTSGSKGVHVVVPLVPRRRPADAAAATRALAVRAERIDPDLTTTAYLKEDRAGKVFLDPTRAGGGTLAAVYSPRVRPGDDGLVPAGLGRARRGDAGGLHRPHGARAAERRCRAGPNVVPRRRQLPADLVAEGHEIPVARVQAMHEGKRRKRAREAGAERGLRCRSPAF